MFRGGEASEFRVATLEFKAVLRDRKPSDKTSAVRASAHRTVTVTAKGARQTHSEADGTTKAGALGAIACLTHGRTLACDTRYLSSMGRRLGPMCSIAHIVQIVVLGACLACAAPRGSVGAQHLPDFARPSHERLSAEEANRARDTIYYRTLTRADFRGDHPPPQMARHRGKLGAATCGLIGTPGRTQIEVSENPGAPRNQRFRVEGRDFRFEATMDRDCSWWNDEADLPAWYVLEHEQIHFALFELETRRLNRIFDENPDAAIGYGGSKAAAQDAFNDAIEAELDAAMKRVLERSTHFDEDTSMGVHEARQRIWLDRILRELAENEH